MEHIRIGMIGCGLFGESHLHAYAAVPGAQVTALYDPATDRAASLAEAFHIPHVCSSVKELCRLNVVDAVDVVSPE